MKFQLTLLIASCFFVTGLSQARTAPAPAETVLHNFASPAKGANPYSTLVRDSSGNFYGTAVNGGLHGAGVVFKMNSGGQTTILYNFTGKSDGATPLAGVILDASGNLYGTTFGGGTSNQGVVYKLDPSGTETVLYSFTGGADGAAPHSVLTMGPSGNLYGTTQAGGLDGGGVVFRVTPAGAETVIHNFTGMADGGLPIAGVILDSAGNLYGTAEIGGSGYEGVVYKIDSRGKFTTLYNFTGGADGGEPAAGVIQDAAGNLYGTASFGGTTFGGVVYKVSPSGQETVLYNFTGLQDGAEPQSGLIRDASGDLYGTTFAGGLMGNGVVYKVNAKGNETVIETFSGDPGGAHSFAGVTPDAAGNLYGTTANGGVGYGLVYRIATSGEESTLFTFPGVTDGFAAYSTVTRDSAGNLFGTTFQGGVGANGAVYEISTGGTEKVLYSFKGAPDGALPYAGVVLDAQGNLYGTTNSGGADDQGTVYKLTPEGVETILHSFTGGADGGEPFGAVTFDAAGNLYGTTNYGGSHFSGVVFKLTPAGEESVVYNFAGGADGAYPAAGVTLDAAGNLYGTTSEGGANFVGTVYKVDAAGKETILYNFGVGEGGFFPESPVVLDSAGNIYGTTIQGGHNFGVVYKVDQAGNETVLYAFTGGADGANPLYAGVARDAAGNLYGTTQGGGVNNYGVVYQLTPGGVETVIHSFNLTDGANPFGGVVGSPSGTLYGTAAGGGKNGTGVVFQIKTGSPQ